MIVNSASRFRNNIWTCGWCFCNMITKNVFNGVVGALYNDSMWIDGHDEERSICDYLVFGYDSALVVELVTLMQNSTLRLTFLTSRVGLHSIRFSVGASGVTSFRASRFIFVVIIAWLNGKLRTHCVDRILGKIIPVRFGKLTKFCILGDRRSLLFMATNDR